MSDCPDKDCGDNVTRLVFFMKIFGLSLTALCAIFVGVISYGLNADAKDKTRVQNIDKQVQVYSVRQEAMLEDISDIKTDLKEIKKNHTIQMESIKKKMEDDKTDIIDEIRKN